MSKMLETSWHKNLSPHGNIGANLLEKFKSFPGDIDLLSHNIVHIET